MIETLSIWQSFLSPPTMVTRSITRRDVLLVLVGAVSMYVWSFAFFRPRETTSIIIDTQLNSEPNIIPPTHYHTDADSQDPDLDPLKGPHSPLTTLPHTSIIAHAPGWTMFKNLYMANGTLFIVSPSSNDTFPQIRMITSPGYPAENNPEDIARREPTADHMDILTPEIADSRWKRTGDDGESYYRVWSVKGNTVLFNDPSQFLHHYYHFVAELFLGMWAFWYGAFTKPSTNVALSLFHSDAPYPPPIHRIIFVHSDTNGWHDRPEFDAYFLRAAFPYVAVEDQLSWSDRVWTTFPRSVDPASHRAWHFPLVLLADRSAAFRGVVCGAQTQRTAAEAWQYMIEQKRLLGVHAASWWDPLREAVWAFAGVDSGDARGWMKKTFKQERNSDKEVTPDSVREGAFQDLLPAPETVTISYISRNAGGRRTLTAAAHDDLVLSLTELVERRKERGEKWIFNLVEAEKLSRDEQVRMAANTTIMLGVHGNGLTHLVFMPPTNVSTVIEIFYPKGYAHDYQWTATALGMKHFGVWNDTHFTLPNEPEVHYPEGFQGNEIPVHGPTVAKLIEDRIDGKI